MRTFKYCTDCKRKTYQKISILEEADKNNTTKYTCIDCKKVTTGRAYVKVCDGEKIKPSKVWWKNI